MKCYCDCDCGNKVEQNEKNRYEIEGKFFYLCKCGKLHSDHIPAD